MGTSELDRGSCEQRPAARRNRKPSATKCAQLPNEGRTEWAATLGGEKGHCPRTALPGLWTGCAALVQQQCQRPPLHAPARPRAPCRWLEQLLGLQHARMAALDQRYAEGLRALQEEFER